MLRRLAAVILPLFFLFVYFPLKEPDGILPQNREIVAVQPQYTLQSSITLLNFGDMMFDRGVRIRIEEGLDPLLYLPEIGNFSSTTYDFVIANLEGPIIETRRENCQKKPYSFQFASTTARLLYGRINTVNLANNHSSDCMRAGVESTRRYLDLFGISYFGGGTIEESFLEREIKGEKVAFVGIDLTFDPVLYERFTNLVSTVKQRNDLVIVNVHWGNEYEFIAAEKQVVAAHQLIDAGADIIFGHHPHVIQPLEIYKGGVIFYSLGNFVFDQKGEETTKGIGVGAVFSEKEIKFYVLPYRIKSEQLMPFSHSEMISFCEEYLADIENKANCSFTIQED